MQRSTFLATSPSDLRPVAGATLAAEGITWKCER